MNSKLYDKLYPIPKPVLDRIQNAVVQYPNSNGIQRANFLLKNTTISYSNLKRLKNYFDNFSGDKNDMIQFELAGGDLMMQFVNTTLKDERNRVKKTKERTSDVHANPMNALRAQRANMMIHENANITDELEQYVLAVLFDENMNILLLKRSSYQDQWQPNKWALIGGKVDKNEELVDAIKREIKEEIGLNIDTIIKKFTIQRTSNGIEHIFVGKCDNPDNISLNFEHSMWNFYSYGQLRYLNVVPNLIDYVNIAIKNYNN